MHFLALELGYGFHDVVDNSYFWERGKEAVSFKRVLKNSSMVIYPIGIISSESVDPHLSPSRGGSNGSWHWYWHWSFIPVSTRSDSSTVGMTLLEFHVTIVELYRNGISAQVLRAPRLMYRHVAMAITLRLPGRFTPCHIACLVGQWWSIDHSGFLI